MGSSIIEFYQNQLFTTDPFLDNHECKGLKTKSVLMQLNTRIQFTDKSIKNTRESTEVHSVLNHDGSLS